MSNLRYNSSKTYLLPLISEVIGIETKFINYLDNTYMFDENNEFQECIFIKHEFSFKNPEFTAYEHRLIDNQYFVKLIDIGSEVVYVFKFPEEYLPEYYALQNSKYSEFGEDAKKLILKFWTQMYGKIPAGINLILKIKQILYKDEKLKKQLEEKLKIKLDLHSELGEKVEVSNETLKLKESATAQMLNDKNN
jgi:hypothetical protein